MKTAWVYYPGAPYTQECASQAAKKVLGGAERWSIVIGEEGKRPSPCHLYLADYDCIPFEELHPGEYSRDEGASTSSVQLPQLSCYCIRKSLIRKNYLANCLHLARIKKCSHPSTIDNEQDGVKQISPLVNGSGRRSQVSTDDDDDDDNDAYQVSPKTWVFEATSADDLDELLADDLYDMRDELILNEAKKPEERTWYILKPAMADRGMGIRLLDTVDALQDIFEGFDEEEEDESNDDESEEEEEEEDEASSGARQISNAVTKGASITAIVTSQLRHFVIQEYLPRPLLIQAPGLDSPHKFHIRAYVLAQGNLKVYLWDEMLALFAPTPYETPSTQGDLSCHLTNTCLQEDQVATVHLLQDLVGCTYTDPSSSSSTTQKTTGRIEASLIDQMRTQVGSVIAQTFRACASADRINFQPWPYAWEIFGVDLMVELRQLSSPQREAPSEVRPHMMSGVDTKVWLLEVNAQPDFGRSGDALQSTIQDLFERALEITVLGRSGNEASVGESCEGMTLCLDMPMSGSAR